MSIAAKKISQTFNGRAEWIVGGASFFKLLGTVNPVDVELYKDGGGALTAMQVDSGFYQRIPFDRVVITTGALEPVSFLVAPDEGGSDTFSGVVSGTIDVTDRAARLLGTLSGWIGKNRTGSPGFMGVCASISDAGFVSSSQLFNPAASGVTLLLDRVSVAGHTLAAARAATIRTHNAGLANLVGSGVNKTVGGAASVATLREQRAAGVGTVIQNYAVPVGGMAETYFEEPIIIPAGFGVHVSGTVVNESISPSFEWREI